MLRDALRDCERRLRDGGIEDAAFEAQCMLEHLTGYSRSSQIAHGGEPFERQDDLDNMIIRRLRREPLQYILGSWRFAGFDLAVGEGVLIPRDDTEVVLRLCLDYLRGKQAAGAEVADLCAGSGAIAIALGKAAHAEVTAVELSERAFYFLEKNIDTHHAPVTPLLGDVLQCHNQFADGSFDLIVSNPPYIPSAELPALQAEVQFEPAMALDGGDSGLDFYRAILRDWSRKLKRGGALAFELGEGQAAPVGALMKAQGFGNLLTAKDFGGEQRAIIGTML